MKGIRGKMASGAIWMVAFKLLERSIGLISTIILARVLMPQDFGVVAMATSMIALLELFSTTSMDVVLIQRNSESAAHFNTAWTLNVLAGVAVGLLLAGLAWPMSLFYREPRLWPVACALAMGSVITGLENIGTVTFRQSMDFGLEFRYLLSKKLGQFCVVVPLALIWRNYWALVAGMLAGRLIGLALSYWLHPFRPRFSLQGAADLLRFSKWLVLQNSLAFLKDRSADFVIGRLAGPAALGAFSVATEIANLPGTELVAPINRAILPGYSKLAGDIAALRAEYISVMSVVTLIAVPAVAGVAAAAPFVVALMLGPKWVSVVPLLQVLAFFGITQVLQSNSYSVFLALGRPQEFSKITVIYVVTMLLALLTLTHRYGTIGAAWAYVSVGLFILPVTLVFLIPVLQLRVRELLQATWRPILASAVMFAVVRTLGPATDVTGAPTTQVATATVICVVLGALVYVGTMVTLWSLAGRPPGSETMLFGWVRAYLANRLRPGAAPGP